MDDLERLRRANPVAAADLNELVAVDRDCLIESMQVRGARSRRMTLPARATSASALVAAVIVAFVVFAVGFQRGDENLIEASVVSPIVNSGDAAAERFDRSTDLLAVHLDFADRSDGHVAVAAHEVVSWYDLDPVVVAGTDISASGRSVHEYASVMDSTWDSRWLDASQDRTAAMNAAAERWLFTLDAGGTVWVAEVGVSDFTAQVIREVIRQRPSLDTASWVRVVQSSSKGETGTSSDDLAVVQMNATYMRIDPGDTINDTADLATPSDGFEGAVLAGNHRDRWTGAFEYLDADDLDFADVVAILHIVGVGTEHIADVDDFTDFFIGDQPDATLRGSS